MGQLSFIENQKVKGYTYIGAGDIIRLKRQSQVSSYALNIGWNVKGDLWSKVAKCDYENFSVEFRYCTQKVL